MIANKYANMNTCGKRTETVENTHKIMQQNIKPTESVRLKLVHTSDKNPVKKISSKQTHEKNLHNADQIENLKRRKAVRHLV